MTQNSNTMWVILAGLALIGFLFWQAPEAAPAQAPGILVGIGVLIRLFVTDAKVEANTAETTEAKKAAVASKEVAQEAKVAAVASKAVSEENAQTLAATAQQQATALEAVSHKQDTTNSLVDGHLSGLTAKIDALMRQVAVLETDKARKEVEAAHAETSTAQIISEIRAIVPPPGSTPPHGTPIAPKEPPDERT